MVMVMELFLQSLQGVCGSIGFGLWWYGGVQAWGLYTEEDGDVGEEDKAVKILS